MFPESREQRLHFTVFMQHLCRVAGNTVWSHMACESRSGVATLRTAIHLLLTYLLPRSTATRLLVAFGCKYTTQDVFVGTLGFRARWSCASLNVPCSSAIRVRRGNAICTCTAPRSTRPPQLRCRCTTGTQPPRCGCLEWRCFVTDIRHDYNNNSNSNNNNNNSSSSNNNDNCRGTVSLRGSLRTEVK